MESEWKRVSPSNPCPVCGKTDWCSVAVNGSAVICPRVETNSVAYIEGSGWLHKFGENPDTKPRFKAVPKQLPEHNAVMAEIFNKMRKQISPEEVMSLSKDVGVSEKSLNKLSVGYSNGRDAYAFPMTRKGRRLVGIRYRTRTGSKFAAKGSKQGLFVPSNFSYEKGVIVCEGPTDTAAMLDLGLNAIGRPSCNSGGLLIKEIAKGLPVAIISDKDDVGRAGSKKLAELLIKGNKTRVCIIEPKSGKDAREWVHKGATKKEVLLAIKEAS